MEPGCPLEPADSARFLAKTCSMLRTTCLTPALAAPVLLLLALFRSPAEADEGAGSTAPVPESVLDVRPLGPPPDVAPSERRSRAEWHVTHGDPMPLPIPGMPVG